MYGKVFASLFRGSLCGNSSAQHVLIYMISSCNRHGEVEDHPSVIAALTGLPLETVISAVAFLERPDTNSRSQKEAGARIVRLSDHRDWGWRIVNYLEYRAMRDEEQRRDEARERMQKARTGKKCSPSVRRRSPPFAYAEGEGEEEGEAVPHIPTTTCTEPLSRSAPEAASGLKLPLANGTDWEVPVAMLAELAEAFPGVDPAAECKRARSWLNSNPTRRKTARGVKAFLHGWCTRAQDRGGSRVGAETGGAEESIAKLRAALGSDK